MKIFDMEEITLRDLRAAIRHIKQNRNKITSIQRRQTIALDELGAAESYLMGEASSRRPADPREVLTSLGVKW